MKILALEIEDGGKVTRYRVYGAPEASWPDPSRDPEEMIAAAIPDALCECGHGRAEHLPACIYFMEGCGCQSYVGAHQG